MATQSVTTSQVRPPRSRKLKPNGRYWKRLAGGMPYFMRNDDGSLSEMTHEERAFLAFFRALPKDLQVEFDECLRKTGDACKAAFAEFGVKCQARRSEIVWPPVQTADN